MIDVMQCDIEHIIRRSINNKTACLISVVNRCRHQVIYNNCHNNNIVSPYYQTIM